MRTIEIEAGGSKFEAEVAETVFQRMKGLSFRGEGKMLFIFSRDTKARVDLMFLSKPLHLYFLDSQKKVIEVQEARPWSADPRTWKLYSPSKPYRYLLESFESLDISEGEFLDFAK